MKNSIEGWNSRYEQSEDKSTNLKMDRLRLPSLRNRKNKEWRKMNRASDLKDTIKNTNIHIMESSKGKRWIQYLKNINLHMQKAQWVSSRVNWDLTHIITKLPKPSEKENYLERKKWLITKYLPKINSWFLIRNHRGVGYIQSSETERLKTKNSISNKIMLQNWRQN